MQTVSDLINKVLPLHQITNQEDMAKRLTPSTVHQKKVLREELSYWAKKWKVTTAQIGGAKRAVQSESISKIEKYLRKKGLTK